MNNIIIKMKVKDLLEVIKKGKKQYPDFLDFTIALEQHPNYKKCCNCNKPKDYIKNDKTLFIKSHSEGCCTYWLEEKILGLQIHY